MTRKRYHRRRRPPRIEHYAGAPPGTIDVSRFRLVPEVDIFIYDAKSFEERKITELDQLKKYVGRDSVLWVNVCGLGDEPTIRELGEIFGIHRLALEDVVNVHQRAKVEDYDDLLFFVLRMVYSTEQLHLDSEQLSIFLGRNFVLTFQERVGDCLDSLRDRIRNNKGRIRTCQADYLAYAIIDTVIDAYFPIVDAHGEQMERLEASVENGHSGNFMGDVHTVRGDLVTLRRAVRPLRDALVLFVSDSHSLVNKETQYYFRDCYDHSVQLIDLLDNYREMCSDLRDFYLSIVNQRMNEVMKVLTIIGTIFIPLSFIAGLYGMNFNTSLPGNMPELNLPYGYLMALSFMAVVAAGLIGFVYRKGWFSTP